MRPEQLRAARSLIGESQVAVAEAAGMSVPTLKRLESGKGPNVTEDAKGRLVAALQAAGVVFIEENGGGAGVRLQRASKANSR